MPWGTVPGPQVTAGAAGFLLVFSVVQVVWWLIDHRAYTNSVTQEIRSLYTYDMLAAQKMSEAGIPASEIVKIFPHAQVGDAGVALAPEALSTIEDVQERKVNQYTWERSKSVV